MPAPSVSQVLPARLAWLVLPAQPVQSVQPDLLARWANKVRPDRAESMARLFGRVCRHDVYNWARRLFRALDEVGQQREARQFPGN